MSMDGEQIKRAYLVLGPESSGTRLATEILIGAGCLGDPGHTQRWDTKLPSTQTPIVWRRSFPHARMWPDVTAWADVLERQGYEVQAIVTTRDFYAMAKSQVAQGHVGTEARARSNIQEAYARIFGGLKDAQVGFVMLSYESLVQRPREVIDWLLSEVDLPGLPSAKIYDGNAKYWSGYECQL